MTKASDKDLLAAEFVLGALEGAEREAAIGLMKNDDSFQQSVHAWEHRLSSLAAHVPPATPDPALWRRLEASLSVPSIVSITRRLRVWQGATIVALALAAGLALFIAAPPRLQPQIAVLASVEDKAPLFVAVSDRAGHVKVGVQGAAMAPVGKDFELWSLPPGAQKPLSLGVLTAEGRVVPDAIPADSQLLVSLEPKGGSPTGQPTGPVVYAGKLVTL